MKFQELDWVTTSEPMPVDDEVVDRGLGEFNRSAAPLQEERPLPCYARAPGGQLVGGAVAQTWGRCCSLDQLWVGNSHRRMGVGSKLVRRVELEARSRALGSITNDSWHRLSCILIRALRTGCIGRSFRRSEIAKLHL